MKMLFLFMLILFVNIRLFANELPINIKKGFTNGWIYDMARYKDKMYVVSEINFENKRFLVSEFDGNSWNELPSIFTYEGKLDSLDLYFPYIDLDSKGNLWLSGKNAIYCYKNGTWHKYFIDDAYKAYREYLHIKIDKFDNLWAGCSIILNDEFGKILYGKGELIQFNGHKFDYVFQTENPYSFAPFADAYSLGELSDGTIVSRLFINKDYDTDKYVKDSTKEIYFFHPDESINKIQLEGSSKKYRDGNKRLNQIFVENDNKIWFPMLIQSFEIDSISHASVSCCGGLSKYENGKWKVYDTSDGLAYTRTVIEEDAHLVGTQSVKQIIKFKNGKYLLLGEYGFLSFDENQRIIELPLDSILANSEFIPSTDFYEDPDNLKTFLKYKQNEESINLRPRSEFIEFKNREIWINLQSGILILKPEMITSVETNNQMSSNVFPNPAQEILNISNELQGMDFEIIDVLGQVVQSGIAESTQINLENLSSGTYFLNFPNSNIKTISFIKIK